MISLPKSSSGCKPGPEDESPTLDLLELESLGLSENEANAVLDGSAAITWSEALDRFEMLRREHVQTVVPDATLNDVKHLLEGGAL
jgi:hypothetical protein